MKSMILYGSKTKLTNAYKPVKAWGNAPDYFVRVELFKGDYPEALDKAKPMPGETVLNTVPIEEEAT